MRFRYSTSDPAQDEFDSLPRIPLTIRYNDRPLDVSVRLAFAWVKTPNAPWILGQTNFGSTGIQGVDA